MSIGSWFKSLFGGAKTNSFVVDGACMMDNRGGGRLAPRDQVMILQHLAAFAEKEQARVVVVFEGRSLREVDNGGDYRGVTVFFTEQDRAREMIKRSRGVPAPVLVFADAKNEALAGGYKIMNAMTFRRFLNASTSMGDDDNQGGRGGMRGGGRRDRGRGGGRDRNDRRRDMRVNGTSQPQNQMVAASVVDTPPTTGESGAPPPVNSGSQNEPQSTESKGDPEVNKLIDLVE